MIRKGSIVKLSKYGLQEISLARYECDSTSYTKKDKFRVLDRNVNPDVTMTLVRHLSPSGGFEYWLIEDNLKHI